MTYVQDWETIEARILVVLVELKLRKKGVNKRLKPFFGYQPAISRAIGVIFLKFEETI